MQSSLTYSQRRNWISESRQPVSSNSRRAATAEGISSSASRRTSPTVNVDVGFGDATEPPVEWLDNPVLLDVPAPLLRGYARETVVAEKLQTMVDLGMPRRGRN